MKVMKISANHEQLAGKEMPYSHHIQIISAIVFLIAWSLDSFVFKVSVWLASFIFWPFRLILALIVLAFGIMLIRSAEKALFSEGPEAPTVIETGILGHVRHPLYLGVLIIYISFIIGTFSVISFAIFVIVAVIYNKLANYEEQDLERIFGEEYLEYKTRVPKWIPRLSSAKT
jgi:protein-S-isoprenylcysteine O-methyltransferase Ste14